MRLFDLEMNISVARNRTFSRSENTFSQKHKFGLKSFFIIKAIINKTEETAQLDVNSFKLSPHGGFMRR